MLITPKLTLKCSIESEILNYKKSYVVILFMLNSIREQEVINPHTNKNYLHILLSCMHSNTIIEC